MENTEVVSTIVESDDKDASPRKRGRKPGSKNKRTGYFYEEEEEAFVKYVTTSDENEKNRIFREKLLPAFTKMIESIIRRYDLFTPSEDFSDTFHDTLSFLLMKINNFDVTKGYKAYSYCGTVCKHYLILKRTQSMKKREKTPYYDEIFPDGNPDKLENDDSFVFQLNTDLISNMIDEIQKKLSVNDVTEELNKNEVKIGYALLEMLMNWDEIFKRLGSDKFNKTSVLYFIKEYTSLSTTDVRNNSKVYKKMYFDLKQKLINE